MAEAGWSVTANFWISKAEAVTERDAEVLAFNVLAGILGPVSYESIEYIDAYGQEDEG